jgi:FkbM family methyltransferase
MKLTPTALRVLPLLRAGGISTHIVGWNRTLTGLWPLHDQDDAIFVARYRGRDYAAAPSHYVDWKVLTTGGYEHFDLAVFDALAKRLPNATVLDVGTNVGHHAFVFAALGWTVHAFEPNPDLWPLIEAKLSAARLNSVRLHKVGLGDADATLEFGVPEPSNSGTGSFLPGSARGLGVQLPVRRGDDYLAAAGVTGPIDVVKIDIQGFEAPALRGLEETLLRTRPIISIEIGDENRATLPTLQALASLLPPDYEFKRVRIDTFVFLRRGELEDITAAAFPSFDGNVFCVPVERMSVLGDPF